MPYADFAPRMDATTRAFLDGLVASGIPPLDQQSVAEARRTAAALQAVPVDAPAAEIENRTIPVGPAGEILIRIVRPIDERGDQRALPAIIYLHGGGWVLYDADSYDRLLRELAVGTGAAIVFVNYSRAPEARYPVAIEQCHAATNWIAAHAAELQLDASRLALVGDSAGGNLVAAVTLLAVERGGPHITHQVLVYPVTDSNFDTASYREFADSPILTHAAMQWFWNHYAPDPATRTEPTASPLRASPDQLAHVPPALIITAELDVLRDEAEAYAHRLTAAGVAVTLTRYPATIHGFLSLNALAKTPGHARSNFPNHRRTPRCPGQMRIAAQRYDGEQQLVERPCAGAASHATRSAPISILANSAFAASSPVCRTERLSSARLSATIDRMLSTTISPATRLLQ